MNLSSSRQGNVEQAQAHFGQAMRLAPHLFETAFNGGLLAAGSV